MNSQCSSTRMKSRSERSSTKHEPGSFRAPCLLSMRRLPNTSLLIPAAEQKMIKQWSAMDYSIESISELKAWMMGENGIR